MNVNNNADTAAAASRGASPLDGDMEEDMRRFIQQQVKDRVSIQQRDRRVLFEREKKALANAVKARKVHIRATREEARKLEQALQKAQEKLRGLELENAADAEKERLLEANFDAAMRKLNQLLERYVGDLDRSASGEVSMFFLTIYIL